MLKIDAAHHRVEFSGVMYPGHFNAWYTFPKNHHFIVWSGGKAARNALIQADVRDVDILHALEKIGAVPGNNLTSDSWDRRGDAACADADLHVAGTPVDVEVAWRRGVFVSADSIFVDRGGKGFHFRVGGHESLIPKWKSGCVVCLESCPGGRMSNDRYTMRDLDQGTAKFDIRARRLPKDGTPVVVRLTLKKS